MRNDQIHAIVEKQKKELTESLKYASYIQRALLPSASLIKSLFPESFLVYMPYEIVSGDFYWIRKKKNRLFLVIADCTGHGVPGAFLSILGIAFLNQVVDTFPELNASAFLNTLREYFMKALHQTGEASEQKDGIDMSLVIVETDTNILQFAGAFHPMYIIKNRNQLIEIPGDKMPIGVAAEEEVSFKNHFFELKEGDMVYLFSDGFADQFGGDEGKKFKYRPFRNLLLNICSLSMEEQRNALIKAYTDWKGKLPQLDDITIFAFRHILK